jgi:hypothetical protein
MNPGRTARVAGLCALLLAGAVRAAPAPVPGQATAVPKLPPAGATRLRPDAGTPDLLANWQADSALAERARRPLILFFTLPGCRFCEDVRRRYMAPLVRDGDIVREVVLDSARPVTGFAGAATHQAVASQLGVRFAPVVLLVDARGKPLAEPVVGGDVAGLYGGYLDNAFDQARQALGRQQ